MKKVIRIFCIMSLVTLALVGCSGSDETNAKKVAEEFHQLLPNSELNWVDLCGHAPMMERPEIFNQYLDTFLTRILLK